MRRFFRMLMNNRSIITRWLLLCLTVSGGSYSLLLPKTPSWTRLSSARNIDEAWSCQKKGERVTLLDLRGTDLTDEGLARCRGLPINIMVLDGTMITDDGMAYLQGMQLTSLDIRATNVTDEGLKCIQDMPLSELYLGGAQITNKGLVCLHGLAPTLRRLDLSGLSGITDAGLIHLQDMKLLTTLDLDSVNITDEGLSQLAQFATQPTQLRMRLQRLELFNTLITDAGLAHLQDMQSLQYLDLSYTKITDKSMTHLVHLPLTCLKLEGTKVTQTGVSELSSPVQKGVVMR